MSRIDQESTKEVIEDLNLINQNGYAAFDDEELATLAIYTDGLMKALDDHLKAMKSELIERKIPPMNFPKLEKKVTIVRGKSRDSFNTVKIGEALQKKHKLKEFFSIVSIVKKKVEETGLGMDKTIQSVLNKNTKITPAKKNILSISAMTKNELSEH